jgi:hypothetical protein
MKSLNHEKPLLHDKAFGISHCYVHPTFHIFLFRPSTLPVAAEVFLLSTRITDLQSSTTPFRLRVTCQILGFVPAILRCSLSSGRHLFLKSDHGRSRWDSPFSQPATTACSWPLHMQAHSPYTLLVQTSSSGAQPLPCSCICLVGFSVIFATPMTDALPSRVVKSLFVHNIYFKVHHGTMCANCVNVYSQLQKTNSLWTSSAFSLLRISHRFY